jgi:hypothetical protein
MGYLSYGYKASKTPIGKKVVETVKNIFTKKSKVSPDIKSVKPNVPVTKADKVKRDLRLATQRSKTSQVKLDNTIFRIEQQKKRLQDMQKTKSQTQTRPGKQNLAKGGRVEYKRGTGLMKKKSNVDKIKKTFGTLSVRAGIDNNPNPTYADKIAGAKMKNKKKKKFV